MTDVDILAMNDDEVMATCQALAVLLGAKAPDRPAEAEQPPPVEDLPRFGGPAADELISTLQKSDTHEAARALLLLADELGLSAEIQSARAGTAHTRDLGLVTGPLIVAGLAVVLSWVPVEQRSRIRRLRYRSRGGDELESEEVLTETRRAGPAAINALADWFKSTLG